MTKKKKPEKIDWTKKGGNPVSVVFRHKDEVVVAGNTIIFVVNVTKNGALLAFVRNGEGNSPRRAETLSYEELQPVLPVLNEDCRNKLLAKKRRREERMLSPQTCSVQLQDKTSCEKPVSDSEHSEPVFKQLSSRNPDKSSTQ